MGGRLWLPVSARASLQFGVVAVEQFAELGVSMTTVSRWAQEERLHRIHRGVYAVGHRHLTQRARWKAGLLACADDAALSRDSAAAVLGLAYDWGAVHVTTASKKGHKAALDVHRGDLHPDDITTRYGMRVTSWARTAIDVAAAWKQDRVAQLLDKTVALELYDHRTMLATIERARGHHGLKVLVPLVARLGDRAEGFRSRAERRARDALVARGVREPEINAWIPVAGVAGGGYEADLYFRDVRVDIEIDGPHHRLPFQQAHDQRRDTDLDEIAVCVARFEANLADRQPDWFAGRVDAILQARAPRCARQVGTTGRT